MGRPDRALERIVVQRANGRCEYCHFPEAAAEHSFHVDHIIAEKHDGPTIAANLAWACFSCNLHKGSNIAGIDPITGELTALFHPREHVWQTHFEWQGPWLRGRTAIGRTTVIVLEINTADAIAVRTSLIEEGMM